MLALSPELETLDQLLGGDLPLAVVRGLYPDPTSFRAGILAQLATGDVELIGSDGKLVPKWRWREALESQESGKLRVKLTKQGARTIA